MIRKRVKADGEGFYHVISRTAGKAFRLEGQEGERLTEGIRRAAAFSGVEVYTYAMMSNHFHLLVRVPEKREVGEVELVQRLESLFGRGGAIKILHRWEGWERKGKAYLAEDEKRRFRARMFDLTQFVKTFKETFSKDYNKRHKYNGSIWEGRFKSVLLEPGQETLLAVARYIHLNPVRAEMCRTAEEAGNTAYGKSCGKAAESEARKGLMALAKLLCGQDVSWEEAREAFAAGVRGVSGKKGAEDGPTDDWLRKRLPEFTAGGALGRAAFAAAVAAAYPRRKRLGPHGMAAGWGLVSAFEVRGTRD